MKALNRKTLWALLCLFLAAGTACETSRNEAKVAAVQNTGAASANETALQTSSSNETPSVSPSQAVTVSAAEISLRAGEKAEAVVAVIVADGYHINGNPASEDYLRPTELKLEPAAEINLGKFVYPPAEMKKFDFAEKPISVYEGTVNIKIPIQTNKNAKPGRTVLRGTVRAQPCNDSACFPSRTIEVYLPIQLTQ